MQPPRFGCEPIPIHDASAFNQSGYVADHAERGPPMLSGMGAQIDQLVGRRKRSDPSSLKFDPLRSRPKRVFIRKEANPTRADLPVDIDIVSAALALEAGWKRAEDFRLCATVIGGGRRVSVGYQDSNRAGQIRTVNQ